MTPGRTHTEACARGCQADARVGRGVEPGINAVGARARQIGPCALQGTDTRANRWSARRPRPVQIVVAAGFASWPRSPGQQLGAKSCS
jgi:hypothetical protein